MIALWCTSAMAAQVAIVVTNPDELAAVAYGGLAAGLYGAFADLPGAVNEQVAAGVADTFKAEGIDDLVVVSVMPAEWKPYTRTYTFAAGELIPVEPVEGVYNAIVIDVPNPIRLAKRREGAAKVVVGRMMGFRVKKITMETLAAEVARGLAEHDVLPALTYTWW